MRNGIIVTALLNNIGGIIDIDLDCLVVGSPTWLICVKNSCEVGKCFREKAVLEVRTRPNNRQRKLA